MNDTGFKKGHIPWNKKEPVFINCLFCNKTTQIRPAQLLRAKYCSYKCRQHDRKALSIKDLFYKIGFTIKKKCWIWNGYKNENGYGIFAYEGKDYRAHRVAYEIYKGKIGKTIFICHDCPEGDNPSCVNPNHLFPGTNYDNVQDMISKKRNSYGEKHNSKLKEAEVIEIKKLLITNLTIKKIAGKFNVSTGAISDIKSGKNWKSVQID